MRDRRRTYVDDHVWSLEERFETPRGDGGTANQRRLDSQWRRGLPGAIMSHVESMELGYRGTELRRKLVAAVLRGEKIATASLREEYEPHTNEQLPQPGESFVLRGYDDEPLGVVKTTEVRVVRAGDVDLQFARDEGEGFETVEQWRSEHEQFWANQKITDETLVVCERFTLVQRS
jgi:uncharacterized protein YhfF